MESIKITADLSIPVSHQVKNSYFGEGIQCVATVFGSKKEVATDMIEYIGKNYIFYAYKIDKLYTVRILKRKNDGAMADRYNQRSL